MCISVPLLFNLCRMRSSDDSERGLESHGTRLVLAVGP